MLQRMLPPFSIFAFLAIGVLWSPAVRGASDVDVVPIGSPVDGVEIYVEHYGDGIWMAGSNYYARNTTSETKCARLFLDRGDLWDDSGWQALPPAREGDKYGGMDHPIWRPWYGGFGVLCPGKPSCKPEQIKGIEVKVMPKVAGVSCKKYDDAIDIDPRTDQWRCNVAKVASLAQVPAAEIVSRCTSQGMTVMNVPQDASPAPAAVSSVAQAPTVSSTAVSSASSASTLALDRRAALVIGNSAYSRPGEKLVNPCRDAKSMAQMLRSRLGFEVTEACDLDQLAMHRKIEEFAGRLQLQGVALFFYSGHAVEVGGQNYLLPVGHQARTQSDVQVMGYPLERVIEAMESRGSALNLLLLDACRDNPLPPGTKGATRGLARVDSKAGTIVGFATRAGATAADGTGTHSPYTQALLDTMPQPDLSVPEVLNEVGIKTLNATGGQQEPWFSQSPLPPVFLAGGVPEAGGRSPVVAGAVGSLRVATTPPGARIYVGGNLVGIAPVEVKGLAAGPVKVVAKLSGYSDAEESVLVQGGVKVPVELALTKVSH